MQPHDRLVRRAEPRLLITVAAAGCAMVVAGSLLIGGDGLGTEGLGGGGGSQLPGLVLSAAIVAAGYWLLARYREGPLATAGSVAVATGVPLVMFFLTFDEDGFPPYSTEGILIVSTLAWLGTWFVGPARARPVFLGLGLGGAWLFVLQITEQALDLPFLAVEAFSSAFEDGGGTAPDFPDPTTLGLLSLLFGVGYLALARGWDGRGQAGAATPATAVGLLALASAVAFLSDDLQEAGTGILLLILGCLLAWHGADVGRRFTTWAGGGAIALGVSLVVGEMTDDPTIGGLLLAVLGGAVVLAANALRTTFPEPDEVAVDSRVPDDRKTVF
ncbi:MAG: hypothetical protein ACRD0G_02725 [Acidimicrobiales bacterium]